MIECIFTIDYEIYGNGQGNLRELVYEPAKKLADIFRHADARFVAFVEVAELEMIEAKATDGAIEMVKEQIRQFHKEGFEIGLHLHPQWYNARWENGTWLLDYSEYNLCTLKRERIDWMVRKAVAYLRDLLRESGFTPISFRAGNWLLQPSGIAAAVLAEKGIKVDSSVFKGGLLRSHGLDYRPSLKNGYYWRFMQDVNINEAEGRLLEIPTFTRLVPFWQMATGKRLALQRKGKASARQAASPSLRQQFCKLLEVIRHRYPLKFDFCRMTFHELRATIDSVIRDDQKTPELFKPLVAIGHTKDLDDVETVIRFLAYLCEQGIKISTFHEVYERCRIGAEPKPVQFSN